MLRRIPLVEGEYYHIYNRGVARQPVFFTKKDYQRLLLTVDYYRLSDPGMKLSRFLNLPTDERIFPTSNHGKKAEKLIDIVSFVFMPNHFHFLLRQLKEKGISIFLSKITNSYTKYVNTRHSRVGPLFQGIFKAVHVETDEQLIHLSRYIHLNPIVSFVVKEADFLPYPWSSLPDYLRSRSSLVNLESVLGHFSSSEEYKQFILDQVDYAKKLEEIKHLVVES